MQERSKRLIAATALCLTVAGCATTGALRSARSAETQQDYDRAVVEYSRALKLDPDNVDARTGLQRAKVRSAQDHYVRGRRLAAAGQLANAVNEYQLATELNPDAAEIQTELQSAQNQLRAQVAVNREGKTELESLIDRMRDMAPRGRELPSTAPLPDSLVFRNANSQEVITALARMANVNVVFDPAFRPTTIPALDLRGQTFDQAMQAIGASTQTFFRVTAPGTITVIPDTPAKRREYEEEAVKTFYLSNAEPKETADLLRIVIDARQIAVSAPNNAISIRDTPERLAAAGRLIEAIDKARPEVVVDTELLEVNRTRLNEFGLQLASSGSAGINGVADVNKTGLTLANLENLSATDVLLTSVPALYYRLLKSDQNTRVLANTNLRATAGLVAQTRFGERVPVPVTTFSPIATGGVAQQPITSYNYENIGVNIDITPRIHMDNSVTLTMKITVTSISGTGFGGLPTFGNREITTQLRLKDGETNMLAGLIRDDEIKLREGIPGIGDLPGVGRLFSHTNNQRNQSDIILMLTPHIVRTLDLKEDDLRSFLMGRDLGTGVGSGLELPLPGLPPPTQAPPQAVPPQQNPAAPVQPLTPPAPAPPPTPAPQGQQPTNPTPAPPQG
ncbi:MAG TPA: secretin N-terminal domain-containing protein [Vicinamibacterales bacterium]|jgi:general secretion pathway protein D|nr:secretin N-terminal domain-containing protein [Vicinamibacterales bacterium]